MSEDRICTHEAFYLPRIPFECTQLTGGLLCYLDTHSYVFGVGGGIRTLAHRSAYRFSKPAPSASWVPRHMYEWWAFTWHRLSCPRDETDHSLVGEKGIEPLTSGLSDLRSNLLSYSPIYENPLTLIIQWTFALLTYYLHICSVIEEIRLSFGELPLTSYPSLATKSHRGLITSNFHPSFS